MRRFGGLVVGTLLLTGCGAGGGLASTTVSAVTSTTTIAHPPTAMVSSVATTANQSPVSDSALAVRFFKAVLAGDQQTVSAMAFGQKIDPYYQQFTVMSAPTLDGQPMDYHNGRMSYTVAAKVKSKDGTPGVLKLSLVMDSHHVIGYSSGLYDAN